MVHLVILLLVLGTLLMVAEIFVAGFGVPGMLGITAMVAAAVLMIIFFENGVYFAIIQGVLVVAGIIIFFKTASKRGLLKKLVFDEVLGEDSGITVDLSTFSGKVGVALTPMRPIGTVDFGGLPIEAYSTGSFINAGDLVVVTGSQDNKLFVKLNDENETTNKPNSNKKNK